MHILRSVTGSAIVYTRNREKTQDIAGLLNKAGINTLFFHAGIPLIDKELRQSAWQNDEIRVMVATNAFGMGIDKPDVRLVIHLDVPDSIEAYFQEAGRAGRDGNTAYAVLLCDGSEPTNSISTNSVISSTTTKNDFVARSICSRRLAISNFTTKTKEVHASCSSALAMTSTA